MKDINNFDIIIPTYKPGEKFLRLFEMLQKQRLPYNRLILINTEQELMSEEIRAIVCADKRTILTDISADDFDHAATRSLGVSMSKADAFICMTDDAVPADEYLTERLIAGLRQRSDIVGAIDNANVISADNSSQSDNLGNTDKVDRTATDNDNRRQLTSIAMCYARQLADKDVDEAERFVRKYNYPEESHIKDASDLRKLGVKTYFASDVCCAYNREIFDKLGGFIDNAIFNEDMIYAAAAIGAGYSIRYEADALVLHSHKYTAMQQLHRNFDLGMSQRQHPEVFAGLSSEGEGMKMTLSVIKHLADSGHGTEIPAFVWRTGWRYIGYRLGKRYDRLPQGLVKALAMNKRYVERHIAKSR